MNVQDHVEKYLLKEQEKRKDRERSGKYNPSSFGRCYRLQYWNRLNEPVTNPPSIKSLIAMEEGTKHHKTIQSYLPKKKTEVKVETDYALGYADWVEDDCVYDFKTAEDWKFKRYWDIPTERAIEDKKESFLQLGWYALQLKKAKCCLVGVIKGLISDQGMVYHFQDTSCLREAIESEIEALQKFWAEQKLPPAEPRAFNGNDCAYCGFKDRCEEVERG